VTSRLGTGKSLTFFYSVTLIENNREQRRSRRGRGDETERGGGSRKCNEERLWMQREKEKSVKVEPLERAISSLSEPQSSVVVKRTPLGSLVWNLNGCKR
jgi:hypothetical protein